MDYPRLAAYRKTLLFPERCDGCQRTIPSRAEHRIFEVGSVVLHLHLRCGERIASRLFSLSTEEK